MAAMTAVFGFAGDGEAVKAGGTDPVKEIAALTRVGAAVLFYAREDSEQDLQG